MASICAGQHASQPASQHASQPASPPARQPPRQACNGRCACDQGKLPPFFEGDCGLIVTKVFNKITVDTYYLEYDTGRAGTSEALKELSKHKSVVLGLASEFPELNVGELEARVRGAARCVAAAAGETGARGKLVPVVELSRVVCDFVM